MFYNKAFSFFLIINSFFTLYLLIKIKKTEIILNEILSSNFIDKKEIEFIRNQKLNTKLDSDKKDKDMIGLKYPDILFDRIKKDFINGKIISSFYNFLNQLEEKLIFLEKEINVTKINSFYTSRTLYLKKNNIEYDDSQIKEFHNIMSWLVIHKSTQLKGIASDKYLGCKYVEMKIGKNLCPQRIGVYDNVEDIDFEKLIETGDYIIKISNGCHDSVFVHKKKSNLSYIKKQVIHYFNRDYSFIVPEFFHSFSKKRIIVETKFTPIDDLYEFKYMIFNNQIKMIILSYFRNNKNLFMYYDENYNSIHYDENGNNTINIFSFESILLNEMKSLSLKLSQDFPNFIRVDLYLFQNKIYLSELTFDSHSGMPSFRDIKYFNEGIKNWKRFDY